MNVLITIRSSDAEVNRQLGYFIGNARTEDEQRHRRPRGFFKRLLDAACNPDRPRWGFGGGDQCTAVSCRSKSASLVAWAQQDAKR
jgi:hypothetical protein